MRWTWPIALVALLLLTGGTGAGEIRNSATGTADGVPLDPAQASVRLERVGGVVSRAFAEISPNQVLSNSRANAFTYDILPTIQPGDTGIQSVEITAPPGYANLTVTGVTVGGTALTESCPAPGAGQYCPSTAGGVLTVLLGERVTTDQARIRIEFSADAPLTPGSADFPSVLVDGASSMPTLTGDADGDATDANSISVEVLRTQGVLLQLVKLANKQEVLVGEVVTYNVMISNTVDYEVIGVRLEDLVPPNFDYVAGSARLNGAPLAEPTGNRPLVFDIGDVPPLIDTNGNGRADPGESGHLSLGYQLVVGSGAMPGEYENVVVAKDFCDECRISNEARARVTVTLDPVFDLGLIIGKVFQDHNRNDWQDPGEPGVPGAMVALDDGSYALTDPYGRYHFPAVKPGYRMLKLNLASLPPGTEAATERSRIKWVTPGLMVRANFGVVLRGETESIGRPAQHSVRLQAESEPLPIDVQGDAESFRVTINGEPLALPTGDVRLGVARLEQTVQLEGRRLKQPLTFTLSQESPAEVVRWQLTVIDADGEPFKTLQGAGAPPETLTWNGTRDDGSLIGSGEIYRYRLELDYADGSQASSAVRHFGVDRTTFISVNLTGDAFETGQAVLRPHARRLLAQAAQIIRRFPGAPVRIEGHTDSVGGEQYNLGLSQRRAEAAFDELVHVHDLPAAQFVLGWYGENRPVADNATAPGRARNRRVEIRGDFEEVEQAGNVLTRQLSPAAVLDGQRIEVGEDGRFETRLDDETLRRLELELSNSRGQATRATIPVPGLELTAPAGSFLVPHGGSLNGCSAAADTTDGPAAAAVVCRIEGRTEPGVTVQLDGDALPVDDEGRFSVERALPDGANELRLVARNAQGFSRIARLDVSVSDRDTDGRRITVEEAIPNLTLQLPPAGTRLRLPELVLRGATDPGNRVRVNGKVAEVQPDGSFTAEIVLPRGTSRLTVEVEDPAGRVGVIEREVEVARHQLFLLAFADGKLSRLEGDGFIEGAGLNKQTEYFVDGRLAFYVKGKIAGKYLITAAYDSNKGQAEYLFRDVEIDETQRLLTNLDPDRYYPVYGDSSTVIYDAESEGKFYLALDSETLHGKIGNYALALTDTELAAYQRTLYGGNFAYRSASRTRYGDPDTEVVLFVADVKQAHVEDELRGTGGSLYYLSHPEVIEGSEQVTLVVRDQNTGLQLSRQRMQRHVDYEIKYEEGRLMFYRPVASVVPSGSIASPTVLEGNPVFVQVDYEAQVDQFDKTAGGGRVRQQIGDHVAVGATYIEDEPQAGPYELKGVDAELRVGKNTRFVAEYAESSGTDSLNFVSEDGGISYTAVPAGGAQQGAAWKLAGEIDAGEWFGKPNRYTFGFYAKQLDPGFFSSGNFLERGTEKTGVMAAIRPTDADTIRLRHDREQRALSALAPPTAAVETTLTSLRWDRRFNGWGFGLEYFDEQSQDAAGNPVRELRLGAARFWKQLTAKLKTSFELQYTLSGEDHDQATAGVDYQVLPWLGLTFKGSAGSRGSSALAGAAIKAGKREIYLTERLAEDRAGRSTATVLGLRSPFGKTGKIFTEYQLEKAEEGRRTSSVFGLQRRWELAPGLLFTFDGELANVDSSLGERDRWSASVGVLYNDDERLQLASRNEIRFEDGSRDLVQVLTTNALDYNIDTDWTLLVKYRYSKTRDRRLGIEQARLDERSIGFAYRPVAHDRLNLIGRYTRLFDLRPLTLGLGEKTEREMDVMSLESAYQVSRRVEWLAKGAFRGMGETVGDRPPVETDTYLAIQRFNLNLWKPIDLGLEYRVLAQRQADDARKGWLGEVMWNLRPDFRLGVGYNFTDFSDNEFSQNDYSVEGWFFRIQGRY